MKRILLAASAALALASSVHAQTQGSLAVKDGNGASQSLCTVSSAAGSVQVSCSNIYVGGAAVTGLNPLPVANAQEHTDLQAIQANTASNATAANQLGTANFAPTQVSATTSATAIVAARPARRTLTLENTGTTPVYLGGAGVTAATGFLLPGVAGASVTFSYAGALYAITASGTAAVAAYELY